MELIANLTLFENVESIISMFTSHFNSNEPKRKEKRIFNIQMSWQVCQKFTVNCMKTLYFEFQRFGNREGNSRNDLIGFSRWKGISNNNQQWFKKGIQWSDRSTSARNAWYPVIHLLGHIFSKKSWMGKSLQQISNWWYQKDYGSKELS